MRGRQRVVLLGAGLVALVVVIAAGLTRAPQPGGGSCPDRVAVAALRSTSTGDPVRDACTSASQQRGYTAVASVMGLVLISGLLARDRT